LEDPFFPSLYAYRDYVKVNEGLRAEKTKFWSKFIGEYQLQQNSSLTISLFYKDVEDMIYWEEDEKLFSPSNADAVLQGFGVSVKYFLSKNLLQRLLFDYIHPDKVIPYFPEYKLEAGVKYLGGVNAELLIKYFGKQYPFYGKKESALSSYLILDAKFTKKLGKFITLSLSGKNLLDEDAERRRGYPLAGRVIEGGITLKF
jgi:outer membrane cobalamin receptor